MLEAQKRRSVPKSVEMDAEVVNNYLHKNKYVGHDNGQSKILTFSIWADCATTSYSHQGTNKVQVMGKNLWNTLDDPGCRGWCD